MTEAGKDNLFTPPTPEPKRPTFVRRLETSTILYRSIPTRNPRGPEASFLANVDPGLELEIEGKSWQQYCEKVNPRKKPEQVWVSAKVVSPNSPYEGMFVYVTMGDLTRLPREKKKENQPKQHKLTSKVSKARDIENPTHQAPEAKQKEEEKWFIQIVRTPVKIIYEKKPADKDNKHGEWEYGKTHGEVEIKVEGTWDEIWNDKDSHYLEGTIVKISNKEDFPLFKKRAIISKGEAVRKPIGFKGVSRKRNKQDDNIPF